jgi:opacity protein-like surface antigen
VGLANVLMHTNKPWRLSPYIGGGLGFGHIRFADNFTQPTSTGFAFQGVVGCTYKIGPQLDFKLGYRLLGLDFKGAPGAKSATLLNNIIAAGFSYWF